MLLESEVVNIIIRIKLIHSCNQIPSHKRLTLGFCNHFFMRPLDGNRLVKIKYYLSHFGWYIEQDVAISGIVMTVL